jgi:hypothetical protein
MNYRIGEGKKLGILILALIIDIIEIFASPTIIVAILSGFIQYGVMMIIFSFSGVKFLGSTKKLKRTGVSAVLESIPFIEMLPIYTWSVWKTIEESRREDEANEEDGGGSNPNIIKLKNQTAPSAPRAENITRSKRT